jgi:hypothetical protein
MRNLRLLTPALLLTLAACGGDGGTPTAPSNPAVSSHNAGRDCLQCHGFSLAGTVYRDDGSAYSGAVVRLTTQPDGVGDVVLTLTADGAGNFYTGQAVSWGGGLYTDVSGTSGTVRSMEASITGGACNSCHAGGDRIRAE